MLSMDSNDYDKHAQARDAKREKRMRDRAMRGNRSVFTIKDVLDAKTRKAREDSEGEDK